MGKKLQMLALPIAAVALSILPTVPAHAATGYDRCHDDNYCMFSGLDGTGDIIEIQSDTPDLATLNMGGKAKSDWNRTDSYIHLFSEANYGGCSAVTTPGGKGNFFSAYRDFFDSVRIGGSNGPSCGTQEDFRVKSHS
ncbi:peptidase inhibitor family I36 protein [Nonomuraea sp. NPDC026600]|uniref:peptidase inhibitor family I36 protein n=1 Tax=Nonomuraea sp. NPDC026600 TaxID=3155363 RepID=UPI0034046928